MAPLQGERRTWRDKVLRLNHLTLLRDLLEEQPLQGLLRAAMSESSQDDTSASTAVAAELLHNLSRVDGLWSSPEYKATGDPLSAWLMRTLLRHENPWALQHEQGREPDHLLTQLFRHDLQLLGDLRGLLPHMPHEGGLSLTEPRTPQVDEPYPAPSARADLLQSLIDPARSWQDLTDDFGLFFRRAGAGPFNESSGFTWDPESASFLPVQLLDPVRIEDLIGYTAEREKVLTNTERLVAGLPAHHLLLYGDRGTGKSATVKALAHRYHEQKLRIVQVTRDALRAFPKIVAALSSRGLKFILFIDDLSCEGAEAEYKELKAFLEGSLLASPPNVRVYATSNRRHLVREQFSDREDEVRGQDTLQEKLSLSDRFGMTIIFTAPKEQEYLEIVRGLLRQRGIEIPDEILVRQALRWAHWQNGVSPRTARHFVETLVESPATERGA